MEIRKQGEQQPTYSSLISRKLDFVLGLNFVLGLPGEGRTNGKAFRASLGGCETVDRTKPTRGQNPRRQAEGL